MSIVTGSLLGCKTWRAPTHEQFEARKAAQYLRDVHDMERVRERTKNEINWVMNWSQGEHEQSRSRSLDNDSFWRWSRARQDLERGHNINMMEMGGLPSSLMPHDMPASAYMYPGQHSLYRSRPHQYGGYGYGSPHHYELNGLSALSPDPIYHATHRTRGFMVPPGTFPTAGLF